MTPKPRSSVTVPQMFKAEPTASPPAPLSPAASGQHQLPPLQQPPGVPYLVAHAHGSLPAGSILRPCAASACGPLLGPRHPQLPCAPARRRRLGACGRLPRGAPGSGTRGRQAGLQGERAVGQGPAGPQGQLEANLPPPSNPGVIPDRPPHMHVTHGPLGLQGRRGAAGTEAGKGALRGGRALAALLNFA